jgi:hypothetical protein
MRCRMRCQANGEESSRMRCQANGEESSQNPPQIPCGPPPSRASRASNDRLQPPSRGQPPDLAPLKGDLNFRNLAPNRQPEHTSPVRLYREAPRSQSSGRGVDFPPTRPRRATPEGSSRQEKAERGLPPSAAPRRSGRRRRTGRNPPRGTGASPWWRRERTGRATS